MYLLLYFFWLILNGRLTWEVALLGLAVVAAVGALAYVLFGYTPRREWRIVKKIPLFMLYVFVLLWEILKANWAVLGFIVNEHRAIEPTLVRFTTSLKTRFGRFMLANSITLTPGTITVDTREDRFLVHCLDKDFGDGLEDSAMEKRILTVEKGGGADA